MVYVWFWCLSGCDILSLDRFGVLVFFSFMYYGARFAAPLAASTHSILRNGCRQPLHKQPSSPCHNRRPSSEAGLGEGDFEKESNNICSTIEESLNGQLQTCSERLAQNCLLLLGFGLFYHIFMTYLFVGLASDNQTRLPISPVSPSSSKETMGH